ncbi:hypothetical protein SAMN00120144_0942 [Hymenobacter roseosalivarius DSM 11622]|uniref:Uncharacterized protein n=1 Tax=Hymenobacter roseosalivarius DSM 11622 TaxID=645990 RepID=A0A1W1V7T2_9BACT|nr:hypothetical protein [Hymenobacter roseosalivarius]SMB89527.1 hypothetical protein SAMN00120144_0942 [Hymenobacter roseosalivarius DSM 11622]
MHLFEYNFEHDTSIKMPTYTKFLSLIKQGKFTTSKGLIKVTSKDESWNAGVMALPAYVVNLLPDVYALTEQFYPATLHKTCEQYAFSLVLKNASELHPCDSYVYHYWEHGQKITADSLFNKLFTSSFKQLSLVEKEAKVCVLAKQLPGLLEGHILLLRDRALQAFSHDQFSEGYRYAWKVLKKEPFNVQFVRDLLYHAKRHLKIR